jgi:hypothetical protein
MRYPGFLLGVLAVLVIIGCDDPDPVSSVSDPTGKLTVSGTKAGGYIGKAELERAFVGSWRLVSFETRPESGGEVFYPLGPDAQGQLMYDNAGNMSVHLMKADRPLFASGDMRRGTDEEVRAAFEGLIAYFGIYAIDAAKGIVTHHLRGATFPNWVGTDQSRYFKFEDGRLSLLTPPILYGGQPAVSVLVWERIH